MADDIPPDKDILSVSGYIGRCNRANQVLEVGGSGRRAYTVCIKATFLREGNSHFITRTFSRFMLTLHFPRAYEILLIAAEQTRSSLLLNSHVKSCNPKEKSTEGYLTEAGHN